MKRTPSIPAVVCAVLLTISSASADDWPSFRGARSAGVPERGVPPVSWDVAAGRNVAWSTPIEGLGHSSPVVWGDRVFLTSAVPLAPSEADRGVHLEGYQMVAGVRQAWRLYCLDLRSGRVLWERTAHEGVPRVKRHGKASQASATPVTDGRHVVVMMGSEGLFTYDMEGKLLWRRDLGRLNVGFAGDPTEEWSPASSPVLHDGLVIVQNDRHQDSYLAAFDVATGEERWRVGRDEQPSWATPLVHAGATTTIVTNSPRHIRGHDPATGKERWRVADGAEVKVPTPIAAGDLVIVTGGYPTGGRPIFAIRAATGEVAWKLDRGSPYTPTPIVYRDVLYVIVDNGVLHAYDVRSGRRLYQRRIAPDAGGFSASPVAADGRLYFASEDGDLFVVRAGPSYELLARNDMGEMVLATPAIAGDLLLVRTRTQLRALRAQGAASTGAPAR
jgi:outer membrane protein assembly factor BamB